MTTAFTTLELPYPGDSVALFERIAHLPWPVFLDSGRAWHPQGRYDIIAADPYCTLTSAGPITRIESLGKVERSWEDPFKLLKQKLSEHSQPETPLPFSGGAIGYFGYDLARRIESLPARAKADLSLPDMAVGLYRWAVVVDHRSQRAWLSGRIAPDLADRLRSPLKRASPPVFTIQSDISANTDRVAYADAFHRVKHYIREGDCYQVNLARRFSVRVNGSPWAVYRHLRELSPVPFGAFLDTPYGAVLSVSPERFLKVSNGAVETCPMKGTRPRGDDPQTDQALAAELQASAKDQAENLMIVDLLRNDLGKTCAIGSVRVPKLFGLESFATVHHLVSKVTGRLADGMHAVDLLRGCFPGGSITGAPKLRAMEIIEELEPHRRSVYCGAIGYLGFDGAMDTNIAIRTMVCLDGVAHFWAGGGLVADSALDAEYQEILDKAKAMLTLLKQAEAHRVGS